jgi:hypothetical protein
MSVLKRIALILVIIGAVNWGLVGFFNFDIVTFIFGGTRMIGSRIVYILIGLSGLYSISFLFTDKRERIDQHSPRSV